MRRSYQVTWDEYSVMINGTRLHIFSGEVHPYRSVCLYLSWLVHYSTTISMPVQSLHLDIFQKIKALGFNAVSFYTFWGRLTGLYIARVLNQILQVFMSRSVVPALISLGSATFGRSWKRRGRLVSTSLRARGRTCEYIFVLTPLHNFETYGSNAETTAGGFPGWGEPHTP
jgi:hypothetical protein